MVALRTTARAARMIMLTAPLAVLLLFDSGCLHVRVTEHRIILNDKGGGEARLLLTDIRSDAPTDSLVKEDFAKMMVVYDGHGIQDFERKGRMVRSKRLIANGDTLKGELTYAFESMLAIEGLHVQRDKMFIIVEKGRVIERTNGSVEDWEGTTRRIVWPVSERRLMYRIREEALPRSVSLAPLYRKYTHTSN